jgi:uncharacterized membrane protein YphA (DoxX/SURF4 family)
LAREIFRAIERRVRVLLNDTLPIHVYTVIRLSVGLLYFWFGFLKFPFVPGGSPADALVASWRAVIAPETFMLILAIFETTMGALLLLGIGVRVVSAVLLFHVLGTFATMVVGSDQIFNRGYGLYSLTLAGQYVVKNVLLLAAFFALATTRPRRYPRWSFITPGAMTAGGRVLHIMTRNISRTGLSFFFAASEAAVLAEGDRVSLSLFAPLRSGELRFEARIKHCAPADGSLWVAGCALENPVELTEALAPWLSDDVPAQARAAAALLKSRP